MANNESSISAQAAPSWRDVLPVHPAAELFPLLSDEERRELGEDIKANGLLTPVVPFRNNLLDGRNRLDAMEVIGIKFTIWREDKNRFELETADIKLPWSGGSVQLNDDADPYAYVVAANLRRRHLTSEQKRELRALLRDPRGAPSTPLGAVLDHLGDELP
jgi:hypothetical protein